VKKTLALALAAALILPLPAQSSRAVKSDFRARTPD